MIASILETLGAILLVIGFFWLTPWLGLIAAGACLVTAGLIVEERKRRDGPA